MDDGGSSIDDGAAEAWRAFEIGLIRLLRAARPGDRVVIRTVPLHDVTVTTPYVTVVAVGDRRVRALLSSNETLSARYALSPVQEATLRRGRWRAPWEGRNGDHFATMTTAKQHPLIAAMVTYALRRVLGVPHPALLEIHGLDRAGLAVLGLTEARPERPAAAGSAPAAAPASPTMPATAPDRRTLAAEIDGALDALSGTRCDRGEREWVIGGRAGEVRVSSVAPHLLRVEAVAVEGVPDERAILPALAELNADALLARWVLQDGCVVLRSEILVTPFVAEHLQGLVRHMLELADCAAGEIASGTERLPEAAASPDPGELALGRMTDDLVELLDIVSVGRLAPSRAAAVCGSDRDRMLDACRGAVELERFDRAAAATFRRQGDTCSALDLEVRAERLAKIVVAVRAGLRFARSDER